MAVDERVAYPRPVTTNDLTKIPLSKCHKLSPTATAGTVMHPQFPTRGTTPIIRQELGQ